MINKEDDPVGWPLLLMDLDEVREHLEHLTDKMNAAGAIDESEFAVDMGHIYAHLNRIWNSRSHYRDNTTDQEWDEISQYPNDLKPIG